MAKKLESGLTVGETRRVRERARNLEPERVARRAKAGVIDRKRTADFQKAVKKGKIASRESFITGGGYRNFEAASSADISRLAAAGGGFRGLGAPGVNFQGVYSSGLPATQGGGATVAPGAGTSGFGGFGGAGALGGGGGGGTPNRIRTVNTLTPTQQRLLDVGGGQVSNLLASGVLNPMSPGKTESFYDKYFRPSAEARFQNEVMPQIAESFVGPGTYWGGARAGAEADASLGFENQQMQNIGQLYQQNLQRGMGFLPFGLGMAGLNTGITYGQQGTAGAGGMGGILQQLLDRLMGGQGGGGGADWQGGGIMDLPGPQLQDLGGGGPGFDLFGVGGGLGNVNYEDFLGTV